jgi:predicted dehydrogenase
MKTIIVGMGNQGKKRKKILKKDFIASVDKIKKANFKNIEDVPVANYDAALVCVPDNQKIKTIKYFLKNKKHVLVEKPIFFEKKDSVYINKLIKRNKIVCYTAYNHRFEPHLVRMKKLIKSKKLGKIYSCRMFYGNGTASLIKKRNWTHAKGVVSDIGSHLLDICLFWFSKDVKNFSAVSLRSFENKLPDHAILISNDSKVKIELEMTNCMWKNTFACDVIGQKGSAHINSFCKWGPSTFIERKRIFPSGAPKEKKIKIVKSDPTWRAEYAHFKSLVKNKKIIDLSKDLVIQNKIYNSMKDKY